jgi:hypothetical protein
MNYEIESDCFIIVKVPEREWSLIEVKAGTHLATIQPYEQFESEEIANEEMRKKYPLLEQQNFREITDYEIWSWSN